MLNLGGTTIYIPHHKTWAHEAVEPPRPDHPGFYQLDSISQLPLLIAQLDGTADATPDSEVRVQ